MQFQDLGICPQILKALKDQGYQNPSPIQEKAIPTILNGKDLMGCAQTGSGKTAAFAVPILQLLAGESPYQQHANNKRSIRSLILTPTRELAMQINDNFLLYGKEMSLKTAVVVGGVSQRSQEVALRGGVDILIATPGRLNDLIGQRLISLKQVEIFVLDEADRMLDMGFIRDIRKIIALIPEQKQTLLFSATMPLSIKELVNSLLHDYETVTIDPGKPTVDRIEQSIYFVDRANKKLLLFELLADFKIENALVFTRTRHGADALVKYLVKSGVKAQAIHSGKSQNQRQNALNSFKNGETRILVATDIAARGIDIDSLPYVFNFDLPEEAEVYVHRIGRTGRAGKDGEAIAFCCYEETHLKDQIEKLIQKKIPVVEGHPFPMENFTVRSKEERQSQNCRSPKQQPRTNRVGNVSPASPATPRAKDVPHTPAQSRAPKQNTRPAPQNQRPMGERNHTQAPKAPAASAQSVIQAQRQPKRRRPSNNGTAGAPNSINNNNQQRSRARNGGNRREIVVPSNDRQEIKTIPGYWATPKKR